MRVLILLPPSEGKFAPRRGRHLDLTALSSPGLTGPRTTALEALLAVSGSAQALDVLGLTAGQQPEVTRNLRLLTGATARADQIYTGVLYDALGFATLTTAAKRRATTRVMITSSVFGVLRPGDRIAPYRLSGDVNLPGLGPVAGLWRDHLGPAVEEALGDGLLVDVRSGMYAAFWRPPPSLAHRVATVRVLHEADGQRKVVSHFNKATKGRIVRALLEDGANPRTPRAFAEVLRRLGWHVETGPVTAKGTQLDVVVSAV
ncbi:conserved hypothetical protein [metagenome]|uniref:Peroxide stress protein YaaA n=1 Tax=metagenome TaxID=256318 RepID=A0A2P2C1I8_9ZZZZ